jgi:hypothetical protein
LGPIGRRTSSTTAQCATQAAPIAVAFANPVDGSLVQILGTGDIWKISRIGAD